MLIRTLSIKQPLSWTALCHTFIASAIVFAIIRPNIAYSNGCDVTNHHILYCIRAFGMYLRWGFAFKANSAKRYYRVITVCSSNSDRKHSDTCYLSPKTLEVFGDLCSLMILLVLILLVNSPMRCSESLTGPKKKFGKATLQSANDTNTLLKKRLCSDWLIVTHQYTSWCSCPAHSFYILVLLHVGMWRSQNQRIYSPWRKRW